MKHDPGNAEPQLGVWSFHAELGLSVPSCGMWRRRLSGG